MFYFEIVCGHLPGQRTARLCGTEHNMRLALNEPNTLLRAVRTKPTFQCKATGKRYEHYPAAQHVSNPKLKPHDLFFSPFLRRCPTACLLLHAHGRREAFR